MFENSSNQSAAELISRTWESLRATYRIVRFEQSFDDLVNGLNMDMSDDHELEKLHTIWLPYLSTGQLDGTYPFLHACLMNKSAQRLLDEGQEARSWPMIALACASAEGAAVHILYQSKLDIPAAINHQRAKNAANARAAKQQPAKDFAIYLINKKRPSDGWEDLTHASQTIDKDLKDFMTSHDLELKERTLTTLKRWYKTDEAFRSSLDSIIN